MLNDRRVFIEKLKWRSRRSQLELDLIFTKFINGGKLNELSNEYLLKYQELLELDDNELWLLFQQKITVNDDNLQFLINQIK
jgi:succinate dehydrogenase flavin-adding protein (antitoxin of CptAB toxin-antitoxin module)